MTGQTVSHYRILEKIGAGGMGEVYLAEDTKLKRTVALKFLPRQMTTDPEARKRFEREAQAAAALNHPNIVTIHEIGEHEGQIYIAMEHVEGKTLKDMISVGADPRVCPGNGIQKKGEHKGSPLPILPHPLPITQVIDIASQIASGLAAAHAKGIVHRDIKPQNILVDKDNRVKILDFGLVKLKGVSPLTKESSTLGTVYYMSPEQAMGKEVDHRTDIWSLGVVLYEMLTGKLPFKGDYEQAVIYSILNEEAEAVTSRLSGLSIEWDGILARALAKEPDQRLQNTADLVKELRSLQRERGDEKMTVKTESKKASPFWAASILFMLITLAGLGYLFFRGQKDVKTEIQIAQQIKEKSIAVLPFRDFSQARDQDFFCYGMTDAINNRLAQVRELKVASTTSVMRYKDSTRDIKEIGRELGVAYILEGTIQKDKNRIRLTAQLIDIGSGFHAWSDKYDKELQVSNIFTIQDEVSQAIAENLKLNLTAQALAGIQSGQPKDVEAYNCYLQGMYIVNRRYILYNKKEDFDECIRLFSRAIELDPDYALAYVGFSWAYLMRYLIESAYFKPEEVQKAMEYAVKAYQLNPDLAETNASMAYSCLLHNNLDDAFKYFRKALAKSPNNIYVWAPLAYSYYQIGLAEQAIPCYRHCLELEPDWAYFNYNLAFQYGRSGDYKNAITCLDKIIAQSSGPILITAKYYCCYFLIHMRDLPGAEKRLAELERIYPDNADNKYYRALLAAAQGNRTKALALYAEPDKEIYALLGMKDEAMAMITEGVKKGDKSSFYLRLLHNSNLDNLRSDPRFQEILAKTKAVYEEQVRKYGDFWQEFL